MLPRLTPKQRQRANALINIGSSGPQDGQSDHTGIVQKVENGIVYTVEGNSGDSCRVNQYSVDHYEILGYGVPQY